MIEAYKVGVALDMTSNALPMIEKLTKQFDTFARLVKETQGVLGSGFVAGMDKFASATMSAVRANEDLRGVLRENARLAADMGRSGGAGGRGAGGGGGGSSARGGGFGGHDLMLTGIAASMVGAGMTSFYADAIKRGFDIGHLTTIMRADDRVSAAQASAASSAAFSVARSVPGTTAAGNLGAELDLKNITGSLDEAVKALPAFARLQTVLEALDRRSGGGGDPVFAAAKAMDILGRMIVEDPSNPGQHRLDPAELERNVGLLTRVAVATNARVDPAAYLAFAKQSRVGGMALDDQALFQDFPALLMVQGGSRAGTGEAASYQQFINGQMTKNTAAMMKAHHLLAPGAVWKGGRVQNMSANLVGADEFARNPVEWARKFLIPQLEREGITDPVKQAQAVASFSGRQTTAGFLGEIVRSIIAVDREAENIRHTRPDSFDLVQGSDPTQKVRNIEAAWTNFLSAIGDSPAGDLAARRLDDLTNALNAFSSWAKDNPTTASVVLDVVGGLGAIATGLGALSTAIFLFGPALKLIGVIGKGAGAAEGAVGGGLALGAAASGAALATTVIGGGTLGFLGAEASGRDIAEHAARGQSPMMVDQFGNPIGYNESRSGPYHGNVAHGDMVDAVDIKPDAQQSLAALIGAAIVNALKSGAITARIDSGGLERFLDHRDSFEATRPPTATGSPDVRLGPSYPAFPLGAGGL